MIPQSLHLWQWKMTILIVPILLYGIMLFGQRFPVQERVEAGVSYREMLAELGWGGAYIVSFLLIMGISQILTVLEYSGDPCCLRTPGRVGSGDRVRPVDPLVRPADVRLSAARDVPARHDRARHR